MTAPARPPDEQERADEIRSLGLLDTEAEERFDRLVRIARAHFRVPIALLTMLDTDVQRLKSQLGTAPRQIPIDDSFCGHAVLSDEALVVPDALEDERFRDNPYVAGPPRIRFYAGQPVHAPSGRRLGTVCVMDTVPRAVAKAELEVLRDLGAAVDSEIAANSREVALRESEERYRTLLDNSLEAIFLTRPDGAIDHANRAACQMFGLGVEDFRRLGRQGIIDPGSPGLDAILEERRRTGRTTGEVIMIRGDGSRFFAEFSSNIFLDAAGGEHTSTFVRDITKRKEAQRREAEARAELERVNRLKSEFISTVNHEFRTALTGIQGFSELLRDRRLGAGEVHAYAADINTDARRLVRMITEMLDLDRLESGMVRFQLVPTDLNSALRDAATRAQAAGPGHRFRLALDPGLPAVAADADKLTQVAANLLGNALKYSPPGTEVVIATRRDGEFAEASVRDHGPGIPEEKLERIFERFMRLGEGEAEGTGLGLAIAREIVQLHGGRLWAENAADGGAVFRFTVPLARGG